MTPVEWAGLGVASVTLFGVVLTIGGFKRKLDELVEWRASKAIDRPEFDDAKADIRELTTRVGKNEDVIQKLQIDLATVPGELKSLRELMERDNRELRDGQNRLTALLQTFASRGPEPVIVQGR